MLGPVRFTLALMVVFSHLFYEWMWWQGAYAVFGFYVISGYLMTRILDEVYTGRHSVIAYLTNRALRIYPPYLACLIVASLVATWGQHAMNQDLHNGLTLAQVISAPDSLQSWLANISLAFSPPSGTFSLSPAWSLQVELFYYIAMLLLSRNLLVVAIWFACSVCYVLWLDADGASFTQRYASIGGASIAFSSGSLVYWLAKLRPSHPRWLALALAGFIGHLLLAPELWQFERHYPTVSWFFEAHHFGLYGNIFFASLLMYALAAHMVTNKTSPAQAWLGRLAYPVFLCHWIAAVIVLQAGVLFEDRFSFVSLGVIVTLGLGTCLYQFVERPIETHYRNRIRQKAHQRLPAIPNTTPEAGNHA
ncbi:acyltransferase family protein [Parahaliea mediterranea]|uniref:acyltransferase family protein n=1 Tax=Parahaliea mediterranea TaxID=651086 RepID=UPI001300B947|nr:acyltransferase [Parahaliea mediterranea]